MAQIFISYSHADNAEIEGSRWVSAFRENLSIVLSQLDGRGLVTAWSDDQWRRNHSLEGGLPALLAKTEILLPLFSPRYANSLWCKRELEWFTSRFGGRTDGRVLAGEFRPGAQAELHEMLQGIVPTVFWKKVADAAGGQSRPQPMNWPRGHDLDYWTALNTLAHGLIDRLKELAGAEPSAQALRVWIAAPTDDQRANVQALTGHLEQAGHVVLRLHAALRSPLGADAENALTALLAEADLFVQCVGPYEGSVYDDLCESVTALQHRVARRVADARQAPFMVWRPPELGPDTLGDSRHRELVRGSQASGLEEFKRDVADRLRQLAEARGTARRDAASAEASPRVCISAGEQDLRLADDVRVMLDHIGAKAEAAPQPGPRLPVEQWRSDYERALARCDGLLILRGAAKLSWVFSTLADSGKLIQQRRAGTVTGLLDAAAPGTPPLRIKQPRLNLLDCRDGLSPGPLEAFVRQLRPGSGAAGA